MMERPRLDLKDLVLYEVGEQDDECELDDPDLLDLSEEEIEDRRCQLIVARLRHHPGQQIPDWWEECPVCLGPGCAWCDETGWMHPHRVEWVGDQLPYVQANAALAARLLLEGQGTQGQRTLFMFAIERAARTFVDACTPVGETWQDSLDQYWPPPQTHSSDEDGPSPSAGTTAEE